MKLAEVFKDILDLLLRRRYHPEIMPIQQLRVSDKKQGHWHATGSEPQTLLIGDLPVGLSEVMLKASATRVVAAGIFIDRGNGFGMDLHSPIGTLNPEMQVHYGYLQLRPPVEAVRFDPADFPCEIQIQELYVRRISRAEIAMRVMIPWVRRVGFHPSEWIRAFHRFKPIWRRSGLRGVWRLIYSRLAPGTDLYPAWLAAHELNEEKRSRLHKEQSAFSYRPLISILMPVYNTDARWLEAALDSVFEQIYDHWELCIADDASTEPHVRRILETYQSRDKRIKVVWRPENEHIVAASNSAFGIASGEFVAMLDHDDKLHPDALFRAVRMLNECPELDMIYSDEDKLSEQDGRHAPYFKPDWSPDLFLSQMYTAHFALYRRSLVAKVGGFRTGFDGAQDYDLVLRLTERTNKIGHIPTVLYSWRRTEGSTALLSSSKGYAYAAAKRAIEGAIKRSEGNGIVEPVSGYPGHFCVHWSLQNDPLISIVILTRDKADFLQRCLRSIYTLSTYKNYEIILLDNGSQEERTEHLISEWRAKEPIRFRCERTDQPFNFSALNNHGAALARGEVVLFLNNDTEVLSPHWLEEMAAQAQRSSIGAVGALLLYPDNTIQHAGIVLGIGEWAGHSHKGMPVGIPGYGGRLLGPSNYAAVTAACLMMRKELFLDLGGFDPHLAVACGDVELCLRALAQGYYNIVLPHVRLYHYESVTRGYEDSPEKRTRFHREIDYVRQRWPEFLKNDPFYNPNLTHEREDFSLAVQ